MPNFDERTYHISSLINDHDEDAISFYARQFYSNCQQSGKYPQEILNAELKALEKKNFNEMSIIPSTC